LIESKLDSAKKEKKLKVSKLDSAKKGKLKVEP
jgi:hypothetical protein